MKNRLLALSFTLSMGMFGLVQAQDSPPKQWVVESVVMGTDGQMRTRINGEYLTRQSIKQGIKVLDINYQQVQLEYQGKSYTVKPGETLTLP